MRTRRGGLGRRGGHESGLGMADVIVGMTLLAIAVILLPNLFLSAMTQGKGSGIYGEAATWAQAETDYLRSVGYTSSCLAAGTTTITPSSSGCTTLQPALPIDFPQAIVQVENNVGQTGLKRVTIKIFYPSTSTVFYRVVTYVTQFS